MDNLTHALVGLLCAEVVVCVSERRAPLHPWARSAAYVFAIAGNNLPDLDFCYSGISGKTFGYLLQHRGYTHTVPAAFGFALLSLAALGAALKWRGKQLPSRDWRLLSGLALASPLLHVIMDFANNYGVHPFWPLYSGWFYGDSFFIVEPSLWLAVVAPLCFAYRRRWVRALLWLILGVALAALAYEPFVPRRNALVLWSLTALLLAVARKLRREGRALLALSSFVLLASLFVLGSRLTKALLRERAQLAFPRATTLDVVATPLPANPFCWSVLLVQVEAGQYRVRAGRAALWPAWLDVAACPRDRGAAPTAPLRELPKSNDRRLLLTAEYQLPLTELQTLADSRCEAQAFLRFARVPYLTPSTRDGSRIMGDLRYDRKPGLDFSDLSLERARGACPEYVPPWRPPRSDLLIERP